MLPYSRFVKVRRGFSGWQAYLVVLGFAYNQYCVFNGSIKMSLRIRLSLIVSLLFITSLVVGLSYLVGNAKQRVADEIESTSTLAYQLLNAMLSDSENRFTARDQTALLQRLLEIEDARHMDISILNQDGVQTAEATEELDASAPRWFVRLTRPESIEFKRPIKNIAGDTICHSRQPR